MADTLPATTLWKKTFMPEYIKQDAAGASDAREVAEELAANTLYSEFGTTGGLDLTKVQNAAYLDLKLSNPPMDRALFATLQAAAVSPINFLSRGIVKTLELRDMDATYDPVELTNVNWDVSIYTLLYMAGWTSTIRFGASVVLQEQTATYDDNLDFHPREVYVKTDELLVGHLINHSVFSPASVRCAIAYLTSGVAKHEVHNLDKMIVYVGYDEDAVDDGDDDDDDLEPSPVEPSARVMLDLTGDDDVVIELPGSKRSSPGASPDRKKRA